MVNSLPNDKLLNATELKVFQDDKSKVVQMLVSAFVEYKILREKEKILVTNIIRKGEKFFSIFASSHNVFNRLLFQDCLTLSQTSPGFYVSAISPFPTTFSTHFNNCLPFLSNFKIAVCKLFQFRRV